MKFNGIKILLVICMMLGVRLAIAQGFLDSTLTQPTKGRALSALLNDFQEEYNGRIFFLPSWLDAITVNEEYQNQKLVRLLDDAFANTDLNYISMYSSVLVLVKDPARVILHQAALETARKADAPLEKVVFGDASAQTNELVTISGAVHDAKSGEALPGAVVEVSDAQYTTTTFENGRFEMKLPAGAYVLTFQFLDYDNKVIDLGAFADGVIDVKMEKAPRVLEEVVITDESTRLTSSRIGQVQLTMKEVKRSPALMGEVDLIKQIQLLPGVTTVGEAASGFNVRGGSVDQNLVLYDGLPVFNTSHVFGFFSAFNAEAVRDVSFFRGGIPAEYGGRASSVLDIRPKDGDFEQWHLNAGIGIITSNVAVDGPLQKDKTSMAASVRSTYSNWLVNSIRTDYYDLSKSSVFFYDGTLKLTHRLNDQTRISLSGYSSKDAFRLVGDTLYQWDQYQLAARLDHQFASGTSGEFVLGYGSYGYDIRNEEVQTASTLSYRISTTTLKAGFHTEKGIHQLDYGWQLQHYAFNPGSLKPGSGQSNARQIELDRQYALETGAYISDELKLNPKASVEVGLRVPLFLSLGPSTINIYEPNAPRELANVTDSLSFGNGEISKSYIGLEPRISAKYNVGAHASIKLGYNRMFQYLHLVTNTTAVTPVDIWQPSGYYFEPQRADQISFGYFADSPNQKYSASAESFYKHINNIVDFKDGAQLVLNRHLETDLLQGKGYSYGIETYFAKNTGRLTGSMNYTYSRTFRVMDGAFSTESINRGKRYPANFDQPHIFNLSWKYNLSRRHFFTGNFTYHTGRPVTIPLSAFRLENTTAAYFSTRNQYRIPDYHRLDIALVVEGNYRVDQKWKGTWVFSVYNVYARQNPYTVFFRANGSGIPKPYQLSIVGTIFPSITYNIKF